MIALDGTDNKGKLGANAILAVSMAVAKVSLNLSQSSLFYASSVLCLLLLFPKPILSYLWPS